MEERDGVPLLRRRQVAILQLVLSVEPLSELLDLQRLLSPASQRALLLSEV